GTDPGAPGARVARPPAGSVIKSLLRVRSLDTCGPRFVNRALSRAHSSAGERSLHTGEVQGSIPCAPTIKSLVLLGFWHASETATVQPDAEQNRNLTHRLV